MNIIVCIKQVPGTTQVEIDEETGVLKRDGISSKMNPYDLFAIETALKLKEQTGARVTVLTMGPSQAELIIKEAFMIGVDDGYILSDKRFAGSDVLATSYTLAGGISKIGSYDLIICGKQTTDGDTAQVGPAIAEHLNIPHVAWVSRIKEVNNQSIIVEQNMEYSFEVVRLPYPCLITIESNICTPRLPSYLNMLKTKDRPITNLSLMDLPDTSESNYGLKGSPTQVERIFKPEHNVEQVIIDCADTDGSQYAYELLKQWKFI
ncbi:MAG: electron transfer flavoprotein subunit beta/FixA family protein [Spirochaetales bacterium]|nr:electron transfer flavoprotein subunit beta/FixA family protein [Spirochaetales bacterium]